MEPELENITLATYTRTGSVLNNQDLMGQVFKHLNNDLKLESTHKKQILWAGLVCRTFLDPALDVLWRSMHSVMPLLKVLPSFQREDGPTSFYVLRGVRDEHRVRYNLYSRRVREIVFNREDDEFEMIANHTIIRIAQLLPTPLLPALRRYRAPQVDTDVLFIHLLFLCPSLEDLVLENCGESTTCAVGTLLSAMSEQYSSLNRLVLRGTLSALTLAFVPQLTRLRWLEIMGNGQFMSTALIEKLGTLEYLEDLILDLEGAPRTHGFPFQAEGGFQRVKSLRIIAEFSLIQDVLVHISSPSIKSLDIIAPPGPVSLSLAVECSTLMHTISHKWPISLQQIRLNHAGPTHHGALSINSLLPLFLLPNIELLEIKNYMFPVSDDDIHRLATAWPCLAVLNLPASRNAPTFTSLYDLAQRCPQLRAVHMPLNLDTPFVQVTSRVPLHRLRLLEISSISDNYDLDISSVLRDVHLMARYLDSLFPCVEAVSWTHLGTNKALWEAMGNVMTMLQNTRKEALNSCGAMLH